MVDLVTRQEAEAHLRTGDTAGTPDQTWLAIFIPAISEAVMSWLKDDWRAYVPEIDSNGDPVTDSNGDEIPALPLLPKFQVKAAVLLELGSAFRFREGEGAENTVPDAAGWGYVLNKASTSILTPLRRPTVR